MNMLKNGETRNDIDIDLQLFADDGTSSNESNNENSDESKEITENSGDVDNKEQNSSKDKLYTQSDLDRIVTKALETREKKLKKEQDERIKSEIKRLEAEKNNDYKTLYEQEKSKIEQEKQELQKERLKVYAESQLTKNKIDTDFLNVVFPSEIPQSQDDIDARLEVLKNMIDKSNKSYVEELQKKGTNFSKNDNKTKNDTDRLVKVVKEQTASKANRKNIFKEAIKK
jgi:hypothetical protein